MMKIKNTIHNIFVEHTGQPIEKIREDTERDYFMSAEQAMEYGIVDRVIKAREIKEDLKDK